MSEAPFKGFDMSNPTNKMLDAMLKDKFPEFAVGDAVKWNFTKFIIDKEGGNACFSFSINDGPINRSGPTVFW